MIALIQSSKMLMVDYWTSLVAVAAHVPRDWILCVKTAVPTGRQRSRMMTLTTVILMLRILVVVHDGGSASLAIDVVRKLWPVAGKWRNCVSPSNSMSNSNENHHRQSRCE